jgi:riboflavin kinase/FMN adenylyltransferase
VNNIAYRDILAAVAEQTARPVVTIGNFDGVHLGHQAILDEVVSTARARGTQSIALSFDPHPVVYFGKRRPSEFLLTTPEQRVECLRSHGVDHPVLLPFSSELASLTPERFVDEVLHHALDACTVWVGYDFNFGKGRSGRTSDLRLHAEARGIEVHVRAAVEHGGEVVSSTRVRKTLAAHGLNEARGLLGRDHTLRGVVRRGDQRGRTIGFPTANLIPEAGMMIPHGIYVSTLRYDGRLWPSVTSVGVRPTIADDLAPNVETYVLDDFRVELYGRTIDVALLAWLRPELKFDSLQALVVQIAADCDDARRWHTRKDQTGSASSE